VISFAYPKRISLFGNVSVGSILLRQQ